MAGQRLMLSTLRTNQACSLVNNLSQERCLIHVKLTDFCMKTVENLIDSDKGAYFSLWFDENGGTMSIPVEQGDPRRFQFKTAPLHEGEGQSSLECVHQAVVSSPLEDHMLSCWGTMEHKLTVQGTDEVYVRTKEIWESAEKQRKGQRAQEIQVVQGRSKAKALDRVSPVPATYRKPNRPKPPPPGSSKPTSITKISRLPLTKSQSAQPKISIPPVLPDSKQKNTSRNTHSLKDRVIYMLALKPHPREQIVTKLKKATKRSETAMSNLDSILHEVSEISQGLYQLKPHYLKNLDVEQWPFYNEAQKQMLKRSSLIDTSEGPSLLIKRPSEQQQEMPSKKAKLSQPVSESAVLSVSTSSNPSSILPVDNSVQLASADITAQNQYAMSNSDTVKQEKGKGRKHGASAGISADRHNPNNKLKKKKKKKKDDEDVITITNPTSTTSTPDYISQFPALTCDEERYRYKQIFSKEYVEYLSLKSSIDQVTHQNQKECSTLSERLDSVPKTSEEYLEVKRLIQEKYLDVQKNKSHLENKSRFDELHQKLNHIKQMVLEYDAKHRTLV